LRQQDSNAELRFLSLLCSTRLKHIHIRQSYLTSCHSCTHLIHCHFDSLSLLFVSASAKTVAAFEYAGRLSSADASVGLPGSLTTNPGLSSSSRYCGLPIAFSI